MAKVNDFKRRFHTHYLEDFGAETYFCAIENFLKGLKHNLFYWKKYVWENEGREKQVSAFKKLSVERRKILSVIQKGLLESKYNPKKTIKWLLMMVPQQHITTKDKLWYLSREEIDKPQTTVVDEIMEWFLDIIE